jgi:AAA15 family ATPase/GTPase
MNRSKAKEESKTKADESALEETPTKPIDTAMDNDSRILPSPDQSDDSEESDYVENEDELRPSRAKSFRRPVFLKDYPEADKERFITAVAKLTDNYAKDFVDIKFEKALSEDPLKWLAKRDITQIIRFGRQKFNSMPASNK